MLGILSVTLVGLTQMIQLNMRGASPCWGYLTKTVYMFCFYFMQHKLCCTKFRQNIFTLICKHHFSLLAFVKFNYRVYISFLLTRLT